MKGGERDATQVLNGIVFRGSILLGVQCQRRSIGSRQGSYRLIGFSLSSMPLLAARDLGFFAKNGIQAELLMLTFQLSSVALNAGDLEYVAGGPNR